MRVLKPVSVRDLSERAFISTKKMALYLFLAYDGQIRFLGYITQSYNTNSQHGVNCQTPRLQFNAAAAIFSK